VQFTAVVIMSTTNKRKRNDPTETSSPTIKGLNGWQIMNNPDDLIESNNKYSLEKAKGPVTNLKCQITWQKHQKVSLFVLGVDLKQSGCTLNSKLQIVLDAKVQSGISSWLNVKNGRKLLRAGAVISVNGDVKTNAFANEVKSDKVISILATNILLLGVIPSTPYLARLLCLPSESIQLLFGENLLLLTSALRPCSISRCERLLERCSLAVANGRRGELFKDKEISALCKDIRLSQGWDHGREKKPRTTRRTWEALLRLEKRWCNESDGNNLTCLNDVMGEKEELEKKEKEELHEHHHHYLSYGGHDVDPSLNIPNPKDIKRQKYINDRKRPQIKWMIQRIDRLLLNKKYKVNENVHLVDIGGGRGDLAMAVAAFFKSNESLGKLSSSNDKSSSNILNCRKVYVTVIDMNQSSLDAGRIRASSAGLGDTMSFVLCDVTDSVQVRSLLTSSNVDLVFGLHCCGGLTEAAIELSIVAQCSFCVCSCCFSSNPELSTLSRRADQMTELKCGTSSSNYDGGGGSSSSNANTLHAEDRKIVSSLASNTHQMEGYRRAMRAINAMRLSAATVAFQEAEKEGRKMLVTRQEMFSPKFSMQNRVLIGEVIDVEGKK
jgi:hypothetical protein